MRTGLKLLLIGQKQLLSYHVEVKNLPLMKALIVEDSETSAALLQELLKEENAESDTAATGEQALKLFQEKEYDLILLDLILPDRGGFDLLTEFRNRKDPLNLPVIIVSSEESEDSIHRALDAGANDYVVKPFSNIQLRLKIRNLLQVRNIHDLLQQREQELLSSKRQYELAIEGSNDGIWDWDIRTNHVFFSARWKQQLGYTEDELENDFRTFQNMVHEKDRLRVLKRVQNYLKGKIKYYDITFRMKHKDGNYRWIRARGAALRDENGEAYRMAGSHTDVTDARLAEFRLRETNELLSKLPQQVPGVIYQYRYHPDGRNYFPFASGNITDIYEVTPDEVKEDAGPVLKRLHPEDHDRVMEGIRKSYESLELWEDEYRVILPTRGTRWLHGLATPEKLKDDSVIWHGYIRDITQSHNLAMQLKELVSTKDRFFNIIAHDLRNPFNAILGLSQILLSDLDSYSREQIKDFINRILSTSKSTFTLLENLLNWSRAQTGQIKFKPELIELSPFTGEITEQIREEAAAKKIELKTVTGNIKSIRADRAMLATILRNLLTNAVKFTPKHGTVTLSIFRESKHTVFEITDTGIGIPADQAEKIFKIDEKFTVSGTDGETGTGLGLILCKEFVEKHGGSIGFESRQNEGTKFYFNIPDLNI